jgi:rhodanese-related sulfurtransferase
MHMAGRIIETREDAHMARRGRIALITAVAIAAVLVAGCSGSSSSLFGTTTVQDVSSAELEALLEGPQPPVVIDVRTAAEYDAGHIPGSINIPLDELPGRLDELDKDAPVACVCGSGYRSEDAAQLLALAGFETVMNLEDGVRGWGGDWEPECGHCG